MGYFGIDEVQLQKAIRALNENNEDCWLMIHDIGNIDSESSVIGHFKRIINKNQIWKLDSVKKHIIKTIGPGLEHWVFDCNVRKR